MASRTLWVAALATGQCVALAATFDTPVGTEGWHHVASLVLTALAAAALAWRGPRVWRSRRFLGVGVLSTAALAIVSGFYLLYWKEGIRVDGYQDWGVFWHVAWSWVAAVFFFQHTWVNRVAFAHFWRRSWQRIPTASLHGGLYMAAAVVLLVTVGPGRVWFTNETYIPLSLWTWLLAVAAAYAAWWVLRGRPRSTLLAWRGGVDLALVPMAAIATLSGIPLVWFDAPLEELGLQYSSKAWHVVPSIVFTVLVYAHTCQLWSGLRTHWRRLEERGLGA